MGSYTVEQVEFLRQRADISYEEALEVLERCNGDLTRCLVDLERRGLIRKSKGDKTSRASSTTRTPYSSVHRSGAYQEGSSLGALLKKLVNMRLVVTREQRTYVDLPVIYLAIAAIFAPHLMLVTVIAMFVFGLKIRIETGEGAKVGNDQFYDTVDKVADNIKNTVNNFARAAQEGSEQARRQDVEKHTPYAAQQDAASAQSETVPPQQAAPEEEPDVDIPEVTPFEQFTGAQIEPQTEPRTEPAVSSQDGEENEFTIG